MITCVFNFYFFKFIVKSNKINYNLILLTLLIIIIIIKYHYEAKM